MGVGHRASLEPFTHTNFVVVGLSVPGGRYVAVSRVGIGVASVGQVGSLEPGAHRIGGGVGGCVCLVGGGVALVGGGVALVGGGVALVGGGVGLVGGCVGRVCLSVGRVGGGVGRVGRLVACVTATKHSGS